MTTPTSPDLPPNTASGTIAPTIAAIAGGDFSRSRLAVLSDLDRSKAAYLSSHWLQIPEMDRHALLLSLAELGDDSLDFNFNRVYRVGLSDPNPVIRQLAITALWEDDASDLPPLFVHLLQSDQSDDVRAAAADALAHSCDKVAAGESAAIDKESLLSLFSAIILNEAESPLVRRRSLGSVAAFGNDPEVIELIRAGMDDEDQAIVAGAVYAMGRTASDVWIPELIEYMQSEDAELRFEAARAAGMIGEADVVPELAELAYDQDSEVRATALESLGAIGGPAAIRVLRQVEQDDEFESTEHVDDALDAALLTVNPLERTS